MIVKIIAAFVAFAWLSAAHAARVLEQPERSFEVTLSSLNVPSDAGGGLTFRNCESCAFSTHLLTSSTEYSLNAQVVPFAEFQRIAEELRADRRASETTVVAIFVDVDSGRVTRVKIFGEAI